jgi:hypothetical protein
MLRVNVDESSDTLRLKLEGRFVGDEAKNTRTLMTRCRDGIRFVVDLTEVTFVDSVGEEVLLVFGQFGAMFVAETSYVLDICDHLHLQTVVGKSDGNISAPSRPHGLQRTRREPGPLTKN